MSRLITPPAVITPQQFRNDELAQLAAIARRNNATALWQDWYEELLGCIVADGTALTASTTATSLLPAATASPKIVLPADYLRQPTTGPDAVGRSIRIERRRRNSDEPEQAFIRPLGLAIAGSSSFDVVLGRIPRRPTLAAELALTLLVA